jgi:hypothetical protein
MDRIMRIAGELLLWGDINVSFRQMSGLWSPLCLIASGRGASR